MSFFQAHIVFRTHIENKKLRETLTRFSYADVDRVELMDGMAVNAKQRKEASVGAANLKRYIDVKGSKCIAIYLSQPLVAEDTGVSRKEQYVCGSDEYEEESTRDLHDTIKGRINRFAAHDTAGRVTRQRRWGTIMEMNILDRPAFRPFISRLLTETLPRAKMWGARPARCPLGCTCPMYSAGHALPGVSVVPGGHVVFVMSRCPRSQVEGGTRVEKEDVGDKDKGTEAESGGNAGGGHMGEELTTAIESIEYYIDAVTFQHGSDDDDDDDDESLAKRSDDIENRIYQADHAATDAEARAPGKGRALFELHFQNMQRYDRPDAKLPDETGDDEDDVDEREDETKVDAAAFSDALKSMIKAESDDQAPSSSDARSPSSPTEKTATPEVLQARTRWKRIRDDLVFLTQKAVNPMSACDRRHLGEVLSLLHGLHRKLGMTAFLGDHLPEKATAIEMLLLKPAMVQYRELTARQMQRFKARFLGWVNDEWVTGFKFCSRNDLTEVMAAVRQRESLIENFFHSSGTESVAGFSADSMQKRNLDFHTRRSTKHHANAILSKLFESQTIHGCDANQLYHPYERRCYSFCGNWRTTALPSWMSRSCSIRAQVTAGDAVCDVGEALPPAQCAHLCSTLFPGHPACYLADPASLPIIQDDFARENAVGGLKIAKFLAWDAPRRAGPFVVVAAMFAPAAATMTTGNSVLDHIFSTWSGAGAMESGAAAAATTLGTVMGGANLAVTVVSLVMEIVDLYNTISNYRKETAVLTGILDEKVRLIEYSKCRVVQEISEAQRSMAVPNSEGHTLADRAIEAMRSTVGAEDFTERDVADVVKGICDPDFLPQGLTHELCTTKLDELRTLKPDAFIRKAGDATKGKSSTGGAAGGKAEMAAKKTNVENAEGLRFPSVKPAATKAEVGDEAEDDACSGPNPECAKDSDCVDGTCHECECFYDPVEYREPAASAASKALNSMVRSLASKSVLLDNATQSCATNFPDRTASVFTRDTRSISGLWAGFLVHDEGKKARDPNR